MSMHTVPRLTIVEEPQAITGRVSARPATRGSSAKRTRPAREGKSVKKRTSGKPTLSSPKAKARPSARSAKSGIAGLIKKTRPQPQAEMAIESLLPIESDVPSCDAEVEPQASLVVEEIPTASEPTISEMTAVDEALAVGDVESNVYPAVELSEETSTTPEVDVFADPQLSLASETTVPSETPTPTVLLAEPQSIRRTFPFEQNAFLQVLARAWNWLQQRLKTQQSRKRLRVCESVSLGEKRFIAVVQVDGEQFLVGGSSSSVSTLAHLEQPREFADVFRRYGQSGMQA